MSDPTSTFTYFGINHPQGDKYLQRSDDLREYIFVNRISGKFLHNDFWGIRLLVRWEGGRCCCHYYTKKLNKETLSSAISSHIIQKNHNTVMRAAGSRRQKIGPLTHEIPAIIFNPFSWEMQQTFFGSWWREAMTFGLEYGPPRSLINFSSSTVNPPLLFPQTYHLPYWRVPTKPHDFGHSPNKPQSQKK